MRAPWGSGRFERVLVYGLGLSGRAAARLLLSRGVAVVGVDTKPAEKLDLTGLDDPNFELLAGNEGSDLEQLPAGAFDAVVVSPGVPMDRPLLADARRRGLPVIAEVELAAPFVNGPIVAITGSNGKSTTTALTGAMLRAAGLPVEVCGNIGVPLVGLVDGPPGRVFVVELSSFQIEGIVSLKPRAAALLNLSEDHLDRYGSMAAYAAAKKRLFLTQDAEGIAVLNADDPEVTDVETLARKRFFSRRGRVADGCWLDAEGRVMETVPGEPHAGDIELFAASDVPLAGVHNLENAMAAALLARAIGAEPAEIRSGLLGFKGLPHRMEKVGEKDGVTWYDDSKGTNPGATMKSLEGFADGSVHIILGGRNKGADLASLTPLLRQKARRAYLIGEAAEEFARALGDTPGNAWPFERSQTLERAVRAAAGQARPGEAVLLSPACASFDQFRNFIHRGESFQALVRAVLGGPDGEKAGL
jgi:UDP-N-acetylmuramoylalanine--D-glutamate ligase